MNSERTWLVTGVAGFIGSNLLEALLNLDQRVVGLDNFSTGYKHNLHSVEALVSAERWQRFSFLEGDIREIDACRKAVRGVEFVLHQAALGSVPRSIDDPLASNENNVSGFLNMLVASRDARVQRFVYAASSSTYGDHEGLPKVEHEIGRPLSPYAITKLVNELYAEIFDRCYAFKTIGLRYFNVFGKRQDPEGAYAAVIPKWIAAALENQPIVVNGDGESSRDFCFVDNAVQANLLAATQPILNSHRVYNVAVGERTSLNQLYAMISDRLQQLNVIDVAPTLDYGPFRSGDVRHSQASIARAANDLGFEPSHTVQQGIAKTVDWFVQSRICESSNKDN